MYVCFTMEKKQIQKLLSVMSWLDVAPCLADLKAPIEKNLGYLIPPLICQISLLKEKKNIQMNEDVDLTSSDFICCRALMLITSEDQSRKKDGAKKLKRCKAEKKSTCSH